MKKCNGCPFNDGWTEEATKLQDLGCLPDAKWIIDQKDRNQKNWACHSNKKHDCAGLAELRDCSTGERVGFDYFNQPIDLIAKVNI
jgi:hypothetical protein